MLLKFQKSIRTRNLQHVHDALVRAEVRLEHGSLRPRILLTRGPTREEERVSGDVQLY